MIRFHLDENVDHAIARGLQNRGLDIVTATDAGLLEASDEEHVAYALREGRVIFNHDDDFLRIHADGDQHAGKVYCPQQTRSAKQIIGFLAFLGQCLEPEDMIGKVEFF